jgi:Uri superfamily endonuclease
MIDLLPHTPGSYLIVLHLSRATRLRIGALGEQRFAAGDYVYLGSAQGPGGLRARLGRHLRGDGKLRWHIDALRKQARVRGYAYIESTQRLECRWVQILSAMQGASIPVAGFGASDCRCGCPAHLIYFENFSYGVAFASSDSIAWTKASKG